LDLCRGRRKYGGDRLRRWTRNGRYGNTVGKTHAAKISAAVSASIRDAAANASCGKAAHGTNPGLVVLAHGISRTRNHVCVIPVARFLTYVNYRRHRWCRWRRICWCRWSRICWCRWRRIRRCRWCRIRWCHRWNEHSGYSHTCILHGHWPSCWCCRWCRVRWCRIRHYRIAVWNNRGRTAMVVNRGGESKSFHAST
jgi:hypothetical protein